MALVVFEGGGRVTPSEMIQVDAPPPMTLLMTVKTPGPLLEKGVGRRVEPSEIVKVTGSPLTVLVMVMISPVKVGVCVRVDVVFTGPDNVDPSDTVKVVAVPLMIVVMTMTPTVGVGL